MFFEIIFVVIMADPPWREANIPESTNNRDRQKAHIALSPDGKSAAVAMHFGEVLLFDLSESKDAVKPRLLADFGDAYTSFEFTAPNEILVAEKQLSKVSWTSKYVSTAMAHPDRLHDMSLNRNGWIIGVWSNGDDYRLVGIDPKSNRRVELFSETVWNSCQTCFGKSGNVFACVGMYDRVVVGDLEELTSRRLTKLETQLSVTCACFDPTEKYLVVGTSLDDQLFIVLDVNAPGQVSLRKGPRIVLNPPDEPGYARMVKFIDSSKLIVGTITGLFIYSWPELRPLGRIDRRAKPTEELKYRSWALSDHGKIVAGITGDRRLLTCRLD